MPRIYQFGMEQVTLGVGAIKRVKLRPGSQLAQRITHSPRISLKGASRWRPRTTASRMVMSFISREGKPTAQPARTDLSQKIAAQELGTHSGSVLWLIANEGGMIASSAG